MPSQAPYVEARNCQLTVKSRDEISADCQGESELVRRELFFDGWNVKVDGQLADITKEDNLFQKVKLPKGKSVVKFTFWPKYTTVTLVAAGTALAGTIMASVLLFFMGSKQKRMTNKDIEVTQKKLKSKKLSTHAKGTSSRKLSKNKQDKGKKSSA